MFENDAIAAITDGKSSNIALIQLRPEHCNNHNDQVGLGCHNKGQQQQFP